MEKQSKFLSRLSSVKRRKNWCQNSQVCFGRFA